MVITMGIKSNSDLAALVGDLIDQEVKKQRGEIRDDALENARRRDREGFGDETVLLHETLWFEGDVRSVAHNVVMQLLKRGLIRLPEDPKG